MSEEVAPPATPPDPHARHYVTYEDRVGIVHVADSLDDVPTEYRDVARVIVVSGQGGSTPIDRMGDAVEILVSGGKKTIDSVLAPETEATTEAGLHLPSLGAGIGVGLTAGMIVARFIVRGRPKIFLGLLTCSVVLGAAAYFVGSFLHKNASRHATAQTATAQMTPPGPATDSTAADAEPDAGGAPRHRRVLVPAADAPVKQPGRNKKRNKKHRKRHR
ncbi:MAG: hypothetical protein V3T05_10880 [Myxococcota bacterium]